MAFGVRTPSFASAGPIDRLHLFPVDDESRAHDQIDGKTKQCCHHNDEDAGLDQPERGERELRD